MDPMTSLSDTWHSHFSRMPLVAILRGISTNEAASVGEALLQSGISIMEVPLNSPQPFDTIARLKHELGDSAFVGAGTVLTQHEAEACAEAGSQIIIAPNCNPAVASVAKEQQLIYCPGVATATEAFQALDLGAHALKLFPGEMISPEVTKALRAVLPAQAQVLPVGGINENNIPHYLAAGANGFGIGSALYKPGKMAEQVAASASRFVAAINASDPLITC